MQSVSHHALRRYFHFIFGVFPIALSVHDSQTRIPYCIQVANDKTLLAISEARIRPSENSIKIEREILLFTIDFIDIQDCTDNVDLRRLTIIRNRASNGALSDRCQHQ